MLPHAGRRALRRRIRNRARHRASRPTAVVPARGRTFLLLLALALPAAAFDAGGVALGAREAEVRRAFPAAHCRPLEWKSDAADWRCDDAKISFGGAPARITFYLRAGTVEAFYVRFEAKEIESVLRYLHGAWGPPAAETRDLIARAGGSERRIYKVRWEKGGARALLSAPEGSKRARLEAWRGDFDTEIYRVR
jgi:hypothetical protein